MLPPEGPDEDGDELGPPLPPEDRLWRHPSELGGAARAAAAPGPVAAPAPDPAARRGSSPWLVGAVAGLTGAIATLATVIAFGGFDDTVIERSAVSRVATEPPMTVPIGIAGLEVGLGGDDLHALATDVAPALARLEISRPGPGGVDQPELLTTTGSAVSFRSDGYLLTSADLVAGATAVRVILADGEILAGDLVGTDPLTDVAVLRIERDDLPTAVLGTVAGVAVGQPALLVGAAPAPGEDPAITSGIVSSLGRTIQSDLAGTPTRHDMIQTDAPLDPASTGGALLDRRGVVVGITTDPPDSLTVEGLSFATPIDTVWDVAAQLISDGSAHHPWLGIEGSDVEARTADDLQLAGGAQVATVAPGSPADQAGLAPDDVITSVGTVTVTSMADLVVELRRHRPGETVLLAYVRDGRAGWCIAALGERR